jgi:hypothetical protein
MGNRKKKRRRRTRKVITKMRSVKNKRRK